MDIVYNLKKFFVEQQDEAAIPGLGVFYNSTTDVDGNLLPAEKTEILFIEKTPRSNAFVNYLGYEENLTETESLEVLEKWVTTILNDLKTHKVASIAHLGRFEIAQNKVVFIPDSAENTDVNADVEQVSASTQTGEYGLEDLPEMSDPVETAEQSESVEKSPDDQTNNRLMVWSIVVAILIVLAGGGLACYKTIPSFRFFVKDSIEGLKDGYHSTGNGTSPSLPKTITLPAKNTPQTRPEIKDGFDEEITTPTKSLPTPVTVEESATTAVAEAAFKLIGGAFKNKANAEKFHTKMQKEGYASELFFDTDKQTHYVTLGAFETQAKALEFKDRIRKTKGIDCWVYNK